jgi:hypothetical protein
MQTNKFTFEEKVKKTKIKTCLCESEKLDECADENVKNYWQLLTSQVGKGVCSPNVWTIFMKSDDWFKTMEAGRV